MGMPPELMFSARRRLPVFIATEVSECALACLAMIGNYHGHNFDLNGLRQKASISISGANLKSLMRLADQLGFSSRALRVELSALKEVQLPAVVHWDLNHFVVLQAVNDKRAVIHDPARGRVNMPLGEFSNHFTGVVLELRPAGVFKPIEARVKFQLKELWSNLRGAGQGFAFVLLLSIALQAMAFIAPFQMQLVVDQAIGHQDMNLLVVVSLGFAVVMLLSSMVTAARDWTLQLFGTQFVYQVAGNVFRHLIRLPASFFEKRHIGDILMRFGSLKIIQDALTQGLLSAIIDGTMAVCAGVILFFYSPAIALVILLSVVLVALLTVLTYPVLRRQTEQSIVAASKEQTHLMETIRAAVTIKLMGGEAERYSAWRNLYSVSYNGSVALQRTQLAIGFIQSLILGGQSVLVVYLGARDILGAGGMSVGMLYALLTFRGVFTDRTLTLVNQGLKIGMLGLYIDRLADIVGAPPEVPADAAIELAPPSRDISVRGAGFRYGSTDPLIFSDVTFDIDDQDFIAIVGPTGGGKTTLLKLLLGLQTPTEGKILLGGQQASPVLWQQWRSSAGVVRQDDQLLSGSLAENIAFFDPDMDMAAVRVAAMKASVHEEIAKMPMTYMTLIGDMGSSLSGGQRQRVLLARALYRNPEILVLDEGTANLDLETEEAIADMVATLPITRIVVAHRPALVARAKKVFRVECGRVERVR